MLLALVLTAATRLLAQPTLPPPELDRLVQRVALYPDSLLAQTLAASTFYDQIPDAARWANEHRNLHGQVLADAISASQVPWDPSVQAMLPFPGVLDMMARDMNWTARLGTAFLAQPDAVMDAAQRDRHMAYEYGYLRSNRQMVVTNGPFIEIAPVGAGMLYIPTYDPAVVFVRPRAGFVVGSAIGFGIGIGIGAWFRPWGWGVTHFGWGEHRVFINNAPWGRTWANRGTYVHPYASERVARPAGFVRPGGPAHPGPAHVAERPGNAHPGNAHPVNDRPANAHPANANAHPGNAHPANANAHPANAHPANAHPANAHPANANAHPGNAHPANAKPAAKPAAKKEEHPK